MALIVFGQTFRTANTQGFALKNNTASTVVLDSLGIYIPGNGTTVVSFDMYDAYLHAPRHAQVMAVDTKGLPFRDDVARMALQIANNNLSVLTTTYTASSNTFTLGASAAPAVAGTSVFFA